jgi:hypothetical protein
MLEPQTKNKLMSFANTIKGPFELDIRFTLLEFTQELNDKGIKLGTYGVIKGAKSYIAAAIEEKDRVMEQLGYCFEKLILYAESLDLGTCWLGGTFKKSDFARAIQLKDNEILPIVTPVGYKAENKSLTETLMRMVAGSNKRINWEQLFFNEDFSQVLTREEAHAYELPLEMVRIAPSASNKQPWRILKRGSTFHFYLKHTKGYAKMLGYDIQKIDMGIAMCHFELSAQEIGLVGQWQVLNPEIHGISVDNEYIISWVGTEK